MSVWAQVHSLCKGAFFCMSAGMLHLFAKRCFVVWVWIMTGQPIFKRGKNVALILWPEPWVSTEMPQYLATLLLPPSLPSFLFFLFVKFLPLFFCYVLPFFCPSFLPPLALFLLLSSLVICLIKCSSNVIQVRRDRNQFLEQPLDKPEHRTQGTLFCFSHDGGTLAQRSSPWLLCTMLLRGWSINSCTKCCDFSYPLLLKWPWCSGFSSIF